ncbi:DUF429 domain-containing protein [Thermonema rossianum]|uniref:DUF429 domain-containing protein n=1 Tax=Thermonema rossianum TaxID=55505 RepID=UPI0008FF8EB3|nr:DUF429 domain-containing protein [Thermonema rossianum]
MHKLRDDRTLYAGIDGCRGGWIAAFYVPATGRLSLAFVKQLEQALESWYAAQSVWIDIPIGLSGEGIERYIDHHMRQQLRWRKASVFVPPSYEALRKDTYEEANRIQKKLYDKGLSKQAWNLRNKIQEVHDLLLSYPALKTRFRESHPELIFQSFWHKEMPMAPKSSHLGYVQRVEVLQQLCPAAEAAIEDFMQRVPKKLYKKDDLTDASILALRAAMGNARSITQEPPCDKDGLRFRLVF